jgi:hypothetical protein
MRGDRSAASSRGAWPTFVENTVSGPAIQCSVIQTALLSIR